MVATVSVDVEDRVAGRGELLLDRVDLSDDPFVLGELDRPLGETDLQRIGQLLFGLHGEVHALNDPGPEFVFEVFAQVEAKAGLVDSESAKLFTD